MSRTLARRSLTAKQCIALRKKATAMRARTLNVQVSHVPQSSAFSGALPPVTEDLSTTPPCLIGEGCDDEQCIDCRLTRAAFRQYVRDLTNERTLAETSEDAYVSGSAFGI